jgi:hypothetical protein
MYQIDDVKHEIQEAKKLRLSWRAKLMIIVIGASTTFLFALYGRLELALPLMNIVGVLGLMFFFKWKLRKQAWFWITMTVIALFHIPLILFVPWGTRWVPALAIAVIDSADFCVMIWIISIVGNTLAGRRLLKGTKPGDRKP